MPAVLSAPPPPVSALPAGPPAPGACLSFGLRTAAGDELHLTCASPGAGEPDAAAHARALAPALPLLEALESWLGVVFDSVAPQPAPLPWPDPARALTLPLPAVPGARLAVPWALLPLGRAAPPALAAALAAQPVALQIEIDRLPAAQLPTAGLQTGALLLLPRSFQHGAGAWPVRLVPAAAGLPALAGAAWDAPAGSLQTRALAAADVPAGGHAVVLDSGAAALPLAAWFGSPVPGMALAFDRAALALNERRIGGRLVPCGSGCGLLLGPPAPAR